MTLPQTRSESRLYQMKYPSAFAAAATFAAQGRNKHTSGITFWRGYNRDCFSQAVERNRSDGTDVKTSYHLWPFALGDTIVKEQE